MIRRHVAALARRWGLAGTLDAMLFVRDAARTREPNRRFLKEHPEYAPPPLRWLYDAFGSTSFRAQYEQGIEHARIVADTMARLRPEGPLAVCEWGCGPARILAHLPRLFPGRAVTITGTDYNKATIEWCRKNIRDVRFVHNGLVPPLDVPDASFDVVFSLSVFTHLSERNHYLWMQEIHRVLKPGGILIASFHDFDARLAPAEQERYRAGQIVVRDRVFEGSKLYTAYHPPEFLARLFSDFEVIDREAFLIPGWLQKFWIAHRAATASNRKPGANSASLTSSAA